MSKKGRPDGLEIIEKSRAFNGSECPLVFNRSIVACLAQIRPEKVDKSAPGTSGGTAEKADQLIVMTCRIKDRDSGPIQFVS